MWLRSLCISILLGSPVGLCTAGWLLWRAAGWAGIVIACTFPFVCPLLFYRHKWGIFAIQLFFGEVLHDAIVTQSSEYITLVESGGDKNGCILAWAPHGIAPVAMSANPHPRAIVGVASALYYYPLFYLFAATFMGGIIPVNETAIRRALAHGSYLNLCPGGIKELFIAANANADNSDSDSDSITNDILIYRRHCGFARIAFETNTPLVPVVVLHETTRVHNAMPASVRTFTYKLCGVPVIMPYINSNNRAALRNPVHIIYGAPLYPGNYTSYMDLHADYYRHIDHIITAHKSHSK